MLTLAIFLLFGPPAPHRLPAITIVGELRCARGEKLDVKDPWTHARTYFCAPRKF